MKSILNPLEISQTFQTQNAQLASGAISQGNQSFLVHTQSFIRSAADAQNLVVATVNNQPVYLRDVATITDGAEEPANYVFYGQGNTTKTAASNLQGETEAVTIGCQDRRYSSQLSPQRRARSSKSRDCHSHPSPAQTDRRSLPGLQVAEIPPGPPVATSQNHELIFLPEGGRKAPNFSYGDERCCGFSHWSGHPPSCLRTMPRL